MEGTDRQHAVGQATGISHTFQMNHFISPWATIVYKSNSNKITPEMRKQFKRLHSDELLFFTNIKARNANGDTLWADPLQFKIK
jgi:hypothetical protein